MKAKASASLAFMLVSISLLPASSARAELVDFFAELLDASPVLQQPLLQRATLEGPNFIPPIGVPPPPRFVDTSATIAGDFDPGEAMNNLSTAAFSEFTRTPIGATVAAFTFQFDPALNVYIRSTEGLGPILSERAQTSGKGKNRASPPIA